MQFIKDSVPSFQLNVKVPWRCHGSP